MLYLLQCLTQYSTTTWGMHFSNCPDILNMLSPVVSMVQYLHAFCPQRQQRRTEKRLKGEKWTVFTPAKAVSKCILHLCSLQGPPPLSYLVPLTSCGAEWLRGATPAFYPAREGLPLSIVKNINCRGVVKEEENERQRSEVSHIPLKHNEPCTG